jgi:hypothetical protein
VAQETEGKTVIKLRYGSITVPTGEVAATKDAPAPAKEPEFGGDLVTLRDGTTLRGDATKEADGVVLTMQYGTLKFTKGEVVSIDKVKSNTPQVEMPDPSARCAIRTFDGSKLIGKLKETAGDCLVTTQYGELHVPRIQVSQVTRITDPSTQPEAPRPATSVPPQPSPATQPAAKPVMITPPSPAIRSSITAPPLVEAPMAPVAQQPSRVPPTHPPAAVPAFQEPTKAADARDTSPTAEAAIESQRKSVGSLGWLVAGFGALTAGALAFVYKFVRLPPPKKQGDKR